MKQRPAKGSQPSCSGGRHLSPVRAEKQTACPGAPLRVASVSTPVSAVEAPALPGPCRDCACPGAVLPAFFRDASLLPHQPGRMAGRLPMQRCSLRRRNSDGILDIARLCTSNLKNRGRATRTSPAWAASRHTARRAGGWVCGCDIVARALFHDGSFVRPAWCRDVRPPVARARLAAKLHSPGR